MGFTLVTLTLPGPPQAEDTLGLHLMKPDQQAAMKNPPINKADINPNAGLAVSSLWTTRIFVIGILPHRRPESIFASG